MKLVVFSLLSYFLCLFAVLLINELIIEVQSAEDLIGLGLTSFIYFFVLSLLIYFPVLKSLDKRFGETRRNFYPWICSVVLNIPFFVFAVIVVGKAFQPSEAVLLSGMYIVLGYTFGRLYKRFIPLVAKPHG